MAAWLQIAQASYSAIERGETELVKPYLFDIAKVLRMPVAQLLGLDTGISDEEAELVTMFRSADERGRAYLLDVVRSYLGR